MNAKTTTDETANWLSAFREQAASLGFPRVAVAPAVEATGFNQLVEWIESGYAAEMHYFANRLEAYRHPRGVMEGVKSILVLIYPYPADVTRTVKPAHGRVARYAWSGIDYHDTIHAKLKALRRWIEAESPGARVRGCVDTAPLLERELAELAGIGWRGKNTLLLHRELGSYFFLASLLVDFELPYDTPFSTSHCGTCTACLDACPTDAFPAAGVLDASRCISYWTIEHSGEIPESMREGIGDWAFGCDICQEVCPWNRKVTRRSETHATEKPFEQIDLIELFSLDDEAFRAKFRKSPFWRTRRRGMLRNAAIVLGNQRDASSLEPLSAACKDDDPIVAEACRWAVDQIRER
ncbi:MAG: tRNA epoxyqueuosine(34) reductase QueG [Planctomycetota bacterium]